MRLLTAARNRTDPVSLSFLAVTFMTGVAVALQVPTLSLFLAEEVQVRPFLVGLFYTVNAVIGILISQWLGYGFEVMYLASALAYLLCAFVVWRWLPSLPLPVMDSEVERVSSWRDPSVRALFIASTLMWTCNSMYLINMPLYITRELGLEEKLAGVLMGTAAALEIPFMLLAGHYTQRFGKRPMMLLAVLAGVCFYVGLVTLSSQHALIALQLLNAIFIGIVAGIGMSYFQDLMPGRAGVATTLFANSIRTGSIMAGAIAGTVAEIWSFHGVFMVAMGLALLALAACWRVPNV